MTCSVQPLNKGQLQQIAANAGFSPTMSNIMASIALAESGGCPTATNPNDNGGTQTSWGLWQISDGTHREPSGWSNPQTNANMAYAKYRSQGLNAWGTYQSGAYKQYLSDVSSNVTPTVYSSTSTLSGIGDIPVIGGVLQALVQPFINLMQEIGVFLISVVLIIIGVMLLWGKEITGFTKQAIETAGASNE